MTKIDAMTRRTMESCGWNVGDRAATKTYDTGAVGCVRADGSYTVSMERRIVARGTERHPALAAMECNKIGWPSGAQRHLLTA